MYKFFPNLQFLVIHINDWLRVGFIKAGWYIAAIFFRLIIILHTMHTIKKDVACYFGCKQQDHNCQHMGICVLVMITALFWHQTILYSRLYLLLNI